MLHFIFLVPLFAFVQNLSATAIAEDITLFNANGDSVAYF